MVNEVPLIVNPAPTAQQIFQTGGPIRMSVTDPALQRAYLSQQAQFQQQAQEVQTQNVQQQQSYSNALIWANRVLSGQKTYGQVYGALLDEPTTLNYFKQMVTPADDVKSQGMAESQNAKFAYQRAGGQPFYLSEEELKIIQAATPQEMSVTTTQTAGPNVTSPISIITDLQGKTINEPTSNILVTGATSFIGGSKKIGKAYTNEVLSYFGEPTIEGRQYQKNVAAFNEAQRVYNLKYSQQPDTMFSPEAIQARTLPSSQMEDYTQLQAQYEKIQTPPKTTYVQKAGEFLEGPLESSSIYGARELGISVAGKAFGPQVKNPISSFIRSLPPGSSFEPGLRKIHEKYDFLGAINLLPPKTRTAIAGQEARFQTEFYDYYRTHPTQQTILAAISLGSLASGPAKSTATTGVNIFKDELFGLRTGVSKQVAQRILGVAAGSVYAAPKTKQFVQTSPKEYATFFGSTAAELSPLLIGPSIKAVISSNEAKFMKIKPAKEELAGYRDISKGKDFFNKKGEKITKALQLGEFKIERTVYTPNENIFGKIFKRPEKWKYTGAITEERFVGAGAFIGYEPKSGPGKGLVLQRVEGSSIPGGVETLTPVKLTKEIKPRTLDVGSNKFVGGRQTIVEGQPITLLKGTKTNFYQRGEPFRIEGTIAKKPTSGLFKMGEKAIQFEGVYPGKQDIFTPKVRTLVKIKPNNLLTPYEEAGRMIRAGELANVKKVPAFYSDVWNPKTKTISLVKESGTLGTTRQYVTSGIKSEWFNVEPAEICLLEKLPTTKLGSFLKYGKKTAPITEANVLTHELLHAKYPTASEEAITQMTFKKIASGNKFMLPRPKPNIDVGIVSGEEIQLSSVTKPIKGYSLSIRSMEPITQITKVTAAKGFDFVKGSGSKSSPAFVDKIDNLQIVLPDNAASKAFGDTLTKVKQFKAVKSQPATRLILPEFQVAKMDTLPTYVGGKGKVQSAYAGLGIYEVSPPLSAVKMPTLTLTQGRLAIGVKTNQDQELRSDLKIDNAFKNMLKTDSRTDVGVKVELKNDVVVKNIPETKQVQQIGKIGTFNIALSIPFPPRIPPEPPIITGETTDMLGKKAPRLKSKARGESFLLFTRVNRSPALVTSKPLAKGQALALGVKVTKRTPKATFELVSTKARPVDIGIGSLTESQVYGLGYRAPVRKGKKGSKNIFIQTRATRMGTTAEVKAIQSFRRRKSLW